VTDRRTDRRTSPVMRRITAAA